MSSHLVLTDGDLLTPGIEDRSTYDSELSRDVGSIAPVVLATRVGFFWTQDPVRGDTLFWVVDTDVFAYVRARVGPRTAMRTQERFPSIA